MTSTNFADAHVRALDRLATAQPGECLQPRQRPGILGARSDCLCRAGHRAQGAGGDRAAAPAIPLPWSATQRAHGTISAGSRSMPVSTPFSARRGAGCSSIPRAVANSSSTTLRHCVRERRNRPAIAAAATQQAGDIRHFTHLPGIHRCPRLSGIRADADRGLA